METKSTSTVANELREIAKHIYEWSSHSSEFVTQAVDLIEKQQAEIEHLEKDLKRERHLGYSLIKQVQEKVEEIERLCFESNAALPYVQAFHDAKAVIEKIATAEPQVSSDKFVTTCLQADEFLNIQQIARNYLKGAATNEPDTAL